MNVSSNMYNMHHIQELFLTLMTWWFQHRFILKWSYALIAWNPSIYTEHISFKALQPIYTNYWENYCLSTFCILSHAVKCFMSYSNYYGGVIQILSFTFRGSPHQAHVVIKLLFSQPKMFVSVVSVLYHAQTPFPGICLKWPTHPICSTKTTQNPLSRAPPPRSFCYVVLVVVVVVVVLFPPLWPLSWSRSR